MDRNDTMSYRDWAYICQYLSSKYLPKFDW